MEIEIVKGRVRTNEIVHVLDNADFHVFEIDLGSKYPGEVTWDSCGQDINVWIEEGVRTIGLDKASEDITSAIIPLSGEDGWQVSSEASRYTWRIILWKRPKISE